MKLSESILENLKNNEDRVFIKDLFSGFSYTTSDGQTFTEDNFKQVESDYEEVSLDRELDRTIIKELRIALRKHFASKGAKLLSTKHNHSGHFTASSVFEYKGEEISMTWFCEDQETGLWFYNPWRKF